VIHVTGEGGRLLTPAKRHLEDLPADHPCAGCKVRDKAVCGVLDCADLTSFKSLGRTVRLSSGQVLFHEGDPVSRVFTLTTGTLKLYNLLADGRCHVAGFVSPGDFLGISMDDEHVFSAEAVEASQLCWFPRTRFDGFVEDHSPMERELYRMAAHELASAHQQMMLLGRKTAIERLATFLIVLAGRAAGTSDSVGTMVQLPMSRSDIADYLGLTKETVSRVLSSFRRDHLIRLCSVHQIEILELRRLELLAASGA
jgi:CRP/FNR family transcriptional regulator